MYKVEYKAKNAANAWTGYGSYGSESTAIATADRIRPKYFAVRVTKNGMVVYVA